MIQEALLKSNIDTLMEQQGIIANIERYAINDGNGVRTTVFTKGCYMKCRWCCNPETQLFPPEISFFSDKCIACKKCIESCQYGAIDENLNVDHEICEKCYSKKHAFACAKTCYVGCRKVTGNRMTVRQVYDIVKRDVPFYEASGGGVTLSGGEPMAQPEFTYALLRVLTERWIHTGIETCGYAEKEDYKKILPYLDIIFMDIKHMDSKKHLEWTGRENEKILENIRLVNNAVGQYGNKLFIRVPVIPGFNEDSETIEKIAKFVSQNCKNVTGMELLPYHKLGRGKYYSLGREYLLEEVVPPSAEHMHMLNKVLAQYGIPIYKF